MVKRFPRDKHPRLVARRDQRLRSQIATGVCWICGLPAQVGDPLTADHLIPQAHGGQDVPANLRPAHRSCNSARGAAW